MSPKVVLNPLVTTKVAPVWNQPAPACAARGCSQWMGRCSPFLPLLSCWSCWPCCQQQEKDRPGNLMAVNVAPSTSAQDGKRDTAQVPALPRWCLPDLQ